MGLLINNWVGRLGNNIIQLKNCIQIALYYNYEKISIPYHQYFNTTIINIDQIKKVTDVKIYEYTNIDKNIFIERNKNNIENNEKIISDINNFFYQSKIKNIDINVFNLNIDLTIYILKKIFLIKGKYNFGENDVVIHIRSGDIFNNNQHHQYIMPPLSYYTNILNNNNFNKIYLIAEDKLNPVINKLLELYPNILFKINTLCEDIEILLSSKNIIESFGSFTKTLLLLSDNVINIYKPSYQEFLLENSEKYKKNILHIYNTDLTDYVDKIKKWKNTPEQKKLMINYKF